MSAAPASSTPWSARASSTRCWRGDALFSLSPLFSGERVGVRGSHTRRSKLLPLTLTLSPQAGRGNPTHLHLLDARQAAHVGLKRGRDGDGAVGLLIVLQDGDQ